MSTLLFVLFFVFLGLGVLFVAMSGGRGGIGSILHSQKRGSRRFATLSFVVALIVLGFAVPAAVIALDKNDDNIPHAGLTNLTEAQKHGRELFGRRCALCHTLEAANAVAQVGPNLDQIQPTENLVKDAIAKGRSQGNGQMPAQIYTGQDANDVASFVAKAVGTDKKPSGG
jgi:mono/diheme cytochrome c family protein